MAIFVIMLFHGKHSTKFFYQILFHVKHKTQQNVGNLWKKF